MNFATPATINLPQGTDLTVLTIWVAICGGLFLLLFLTAAIFERTSELGAALFGIPAIGFLLAAIVLGVVGGSISAADWAATKNAITTQIKQQYEITLTDDQANTLANGDLVTLNDGSRVKLEFSDHKHRATLVHVNYSPVKIDR